MRITKTLKYSLKRALPILTIASAGMMSSCDNKEDEPQIPTHDVELTFYENNMGSHVENISIENVTKYAKDPSVANIYLTVTDENDYTKFVPPSTEQSVRNMRSYFSKRTEISPKVHGRGNFKLLPGIAAKEDSLWFVKQGWTINQHLQNQK